MEKKRPQLNLTELYQLKWLLGSALALLSGWTVLYLEVEAWVWLVLITAAVPVVVLRPRLTLQLPAWVHRLAFPVFVAIFGGDYFLHREIMPALIRLALMLVFYRTISARRRRDDLQLVILGLFLVVVAGVLSVSLAFAFQIVVFTACTLVFLLLVNLIATAETGQIETPYSNATPPEWMEIAWLRLARRVHQAIDWRLVVMGASLFVALVGLSAVLFFALPRFELSNNLFLDNLITAKSKTGFSENVRFGDVTDIQQDTSVALSVDISDPRSIPVDPYWRMLVLDGYENGQFSFSDALAAQSKAHRQRAMHTPSIPRPKETGAVWTFYLEGGTSRFLPLPGDYDRLQFNDGPQDYKANDELRLLRLDRVPPKMFAYRVEGMRPSTEWEKIKTFQPIAAASHSAETSPPESEAPLLDSFLALKLSESDQSRLAGWAQSLDASANDPIAFAQRAVSWLVETHAYSLQVTLPSGKGDPLVRWMESGKPGHCELFAGAFVLLARSAGYPVRLITGFHGGTWNPLSKNLTIRNSDAHAWCEIFDRRTQTWLRVDPTPGRLNADRPTAAETTAALLARISDRSWSAKLDSLRVFWYRRIVDFDRSAQTALAREAKQAIESRAQKLKAALTQRLKTLSDWLQEPWEVRRILGWSAGAVASIGVALIVGYYGRKGWLLWRSGLTRSGLDPVRREAGRWLLQLRAQEMASATLVMETAHLRADLERLRYGPKENGPNPQDIFRRARRACR